MSISRRAIAGCLVVVVSASSTTFRGEEWSGFRGPNGSGVSSDTGLPTTWSATENLIWKTDLPGRGTSSPIVWGERVFLTSYSGYGDDPLDPGEPARLLRHVLCLDRNSGSLLWKADVPAKLPEARFQGFLTDHGYAASTPATDGERVFVFFGKSGVFAFDFGGKQLWEADVGSETHHWGSGASPVLTEDLVIVHASAESGALVGLNKQTGEVVWRSAAGGFRSSWSTPVLVDLDDGKRELALSVPGEIWGFDPANGDLLWYAQGLPEQVISPSLVANAGVVYAIGGRRGAAVAVRAGGRDDVNSTHVLWRKNVGSYVTSPLIFEGHLYWVSDRGIAFCLNAESGEVAFQERLDGAGQVYASIAAADGKLFIPSRDNGTFVLAARPAFAELARNDLGVDAGTFNASPCFSEGRLLLRSQNRLYCLGSR